jgi:hypothetical protein
MKNNFAVCSIGLLALSIFHSAPASAQQDKWLELGVGKASKVSTSAYIPSNAAKGPVCGIRLQLEGPGIELDGLTVHFGNGQTMHVTAYDKVGSDSTSKSTSLPGPPRTVRGVDVIYRLQNRTAQAPEIHLWGDFFPSTVLACSR